jgi:WXXGXW repeat (2 copies)
MGPTQQEMTFMVKNVGILTAIAAVSLAGCSTRVIERETIHVPAPQPAAATQPAPATTPIIVATVQPPAPQVEKAPPAPSPDSVWIPGYWNLVNGQYVWVPGRYEPARVGYTWVPNKWEYVNGSWHMTGGTWVRQ